MTVNHEGETAQAALHDAFARFNEASEVLQKKYSVLKAETISLKDQLREKDLEIKRAEKLSMLGETAAGIAHEVRNPLGAIKLFISILKEDLSSAPDSIRILDQMDKSVATLDHVVSNILQFSKVKQVEFSPVNLASLINEQVSHFVSEGSEVDIRLKLEGQPFISGNEHCLRQVFYNLLLNACQAVKYSGIVEVKAYDEDEDHYTVQVKDNGPGIPDEMINKLFVPFATTKNEGTGLGLSIVKQILDEHGASVKAMNAEGAVFTIRFNRKNGV